MHAAPAITNKLSTLPLSLIDTDPQIRTRNGFDEASIRQLADSIERNGLLQPILVAKTGDRYRVIAGHRRLAAMRFVGFESTPAIEATEDDEERAFEAQLAENIQREQLTLADLADAVRMLQRIHGSAKTVASVVNKSLPWVSKHLALTDDTFSKPVRALLDEGHTDDLELLHTMNQLHKLHKAGKDGHVFVDLINRVQKGESCRQRARDALAKLKAPAIAEISEDETQDLAGGTASEQRSITVTLSADLAARFEALGGRAWLVRQLRKAEAP